VPTNDESSKAGLVSADQAISTILRAAAIPTIVVGIIAIVIGTITKGGPGFIGALVGAVVACVFFIGGQLAITKILYNNPQTAMTGAFAVYLGQILVLFILIAVLRDATWLDGKVLAVTVVACTVTWILASVVAWQRTNVLYVEPAAEAVDEPEASQPNASESSSANQDLPTAEIGDGAR